MVNLIEKIGTELSVESFKILLMLKMFLDHAKINVPHTLIKHFIDGR